MKTCTMAFTLFERVKVILYYFIFYCFFLINGTQQGKTLIILSSGFESSIACPSSETNTHVDLREYHKVVRRLALGKNASTTCMVCDNRNRSSLKKTLFKAQSHLNPNTFLLSKASREELNI